MLLKEPKDLRIALDQFDRTLGRKHPCDPAPTFLSVDPVDPTFEAIEAKNTNAVVSLEV